MQLKRVIYTNRQLLYSNILLLIAVRIGCQARMETSGPYKFQSVMFSICWRLLTRSVNLILIICTDVKLRLLHSNLITINKLFSLFRILWLVRDLMDNFLFFDVGNLIK